MNRDDQSIEFYGWKLQFLTSLLWIWVAKRKDHKFKLIEERSNSLILSCEKSDRRIADLSTKLQDKENFLLGFSHEFKNLLFVLLGNLQLAGKGLSNRNFVRTAFVSAEMMKHMIMNVLEAGKYEHSANIEIRLQRTHFPSLLEDIWSLCAEIISKKDKVAAKIMLADEVPHYLLLDPQRITQIFLNLVTNATKFTERGAIIIRISWENSKEFPLTKNTASTALTDNILRSSSLPFDPTSFDDDMMREKPEDERIEIHETKLLIQPELGYHEVNLTKREWTSNLEQPHEKAGTRGILKISVQDTGTGMTETQCQKLFQRFSQVSEDVDKRQLGSGLGLWITNQIVEKLGGNIFVDSKLGTGTRFDILLPTVVEDRIAGPSIELLANRSETNTIGRKLSRDSSANSNISKRYLPQDRGLSSIRKIEEQPDLYIDLNEQRWASTTSLGTPVLYPNMVVPNKTGSLDFGQAVRTIEVLVVDDDPFNSELIAKFITERLGLKVLVAQNGWEALEITDHAGSAGKILLALVDLNLKDMMGTQVIEKMKEITDSQGHSPIPCYLVSGEERAYLEELCKSSENILGCLPKPLDFNELQQLIMEHVKAYDTDGR